MINPEIINRFAKGSRPRVLVVTDMFFQKGPGFSLSQFVDTIAKGADVTKASLLPEGSDPGANIPEFTFDKLLNSEYDVCFIFAADLFFILPDLSTEERTAIAKFMEEGGGMFATGDHEDLGARTCKDIPRVQSMRKWKWTEGSTDPSNAPSISGPDRLSTILSGDDEIYEFDDQSDKHLQRLYLNRRTDAGGWKLPPNPQTLNLGGWDLPHPLMQGKTPNGKNVAIVHIPDHPHEGECIIPSADKLQDRTEWPLELGGTEPVTPEIVAKSMSHGGGFFAPEIGRVYKHPLVPREFIAITAYDGHRGGVGRVVTDATWHHFIDINIDGTGSGEFNGRPRTALIMSDGKDSPELELLRQHWRNLAEWLMPSQGRRRHTAVVLIADAEKSILLDELISLTPDQLGVKIKMILDRKWLPYQVNDLVETVLAMGISDPAARKAVTPKQTTAALGAFAAALSKQTADATEDGILANLAEAVKARLQQS